MARWNGESEYSWEFIHRSVDYKNELVVNQKLLETEIGKLNEMRIDEEILVDLNNIEIRTFRSNREIVEFNTYGDLNNFGKFFKATINGQYCIQLGAPIIVATVIYFSDQVLNYIIPGTDGKYII